MNAFSLSGIDWLLLVLVPVVALLIGRTRRQQFRDYIDYFLARKTFGAGRFLAAFIGSNLVFTAIFLVLSFETAKRGWWVLSVPISFFLGTALLAVLYPKLAYYFERDQTLHQALGSAFDGEQGGGWWSVRRWAAIWTILAFVGLVGIEFYGGILLLQWARVPLLANVTIAIFLAVVCSAFTMAGGLRGVAWADIWLDLFSAVGILVFLIFILKQPVASLHPLSLTAAGQPDLTENVIFLIASLALFIPMPICALDTWQRGVAWKKRSNVTGVLLGGAASIVAVSVIAMMVGFYARNHGWILGGPPPLKIALDSFQLPVVLTGLVVGGFFAAILSTADELLNCCSYALLADVLMLPRDGVDKATSQRYIRSAKFYTGFFGFAAAAIALLCLKTPRISDVFNVVAATQVVFFVPLLLALTRPGRLSRLALPALVSTLLAFCVALLSVVVGIRLGKEGQVWIDGGPVLAFGVALLGMLIGWLISLMFRSRTKGMPEGTA